MKKLIKHDLSKSGSHFILDNFRKARAYKVSYLAEESREAPFKAIYATQAWKTHDGQVSLSGTGSEDGATLGVRSALLSASEQLDCKTFIDIGCGDWSWMSKIDLPFKYIGVGIVPDAVSANQKKHASENINFLHLDSTSQALPQADVAFAREILFHFSFEDGIKTLANIKRSAKWFIAAIDRVWFNSDIRTGDFRMINLNIKPFHMPEPLFTIPDDANVKGRVLAVWPTSLIALR